MESWELFVRIVGGSLRLFRAFGVEVFLHWSWLVAAVIQVWRMRDQAATAHGPVQPWGFYVASYLCLFVIVVMHEFGHALACKSVGGLAERIVLWPLGGVAFVQPPPRPGALLWAIAAGPLVNVVLVPVTLLPALFMHAYDRGATGFPALVGEVAIINVGL